MNLTNQIKQINKLKRRIEIDLLSDISIEDRIVLTYEYINIIDLLNTLSADSHEIFSIINLRYYDFKRVKPFKTLYEQANFINKTSNNVIKVFSNTDTFINPNRIFYLDHKTDISNKQKVNILNLFLKTIDTELSDFFLSIKDNIIYHNTKNEIYAKAISFKPYDKYYIYLNEYNKLSSFTDIYALAHEVGHLYEDKFILDKPIKTISKYDNLYTEVTSTFFDTCFLNFIYDNYNLDEALYLKEYKLNEILSCFKTLNFLINNINILYNDYTYKIPYYNQLSKEQKLYIKQTGSYIDNIKYGYGILIGTYFANLYQKDKVKALKLYKDFINKQCYVSSEELYNEYIRNYNFLEEELVKIKKVK